MKTLALLLMGFLLSVNGFSQTAQEPVFAETFDGEQSEGLDGKALLTGVSVKEDGKKQGTFKSYKADGKISVDKGTVSMWIKPVDWKPGDGNVHLFFEARGENSRFLIYKYASKSNPLGFIFGPLKEVEGKPQWTMVNALINDWKPGEWHFVACTWDGKEGRLYLDGELKSVAPIKNFPETPFTSFYAGGYYPERWTGTKGMTVLDELKIFAEPLTLEQIHEEWKKHRDKLNAVDSAALFFCAGLTDKPPLVDGNIGNEEYSLKTTGFLGIWDRKVSSEQSFAYLSRDNANLYVGVSTPVFGNLAANVHGRDDVNIWQDDSIELHLTAGKNRFQFIFNSIGTLYDSMNDESGWNSNFKYVNKVKDDVWVLEAAIPFEQLKVPSPAEGDVWRLNICRTFASSGAYTSLSPVRRRYGDADRFSFLNFTNRAVSVYVESLGNLPGGTLNLDLRAEGKIPGKPIALKAVLKTGDKIETRESDAGISMKQDGIEGEGEIFLEAVSAGEKIFFQKIPFSVTGKLFKLVYMYRLPDAETIRFGMQQAVLSHGGKYYTVCISLFDKGGKEVFRKDFQPEKFRYEIDADISKVPDGEYAVHIDFIRPDGKKMYGQVENFVRYGTPLPWAGNKTGLTDKVPHPWTALKVSGETISCWGREYAFRDGVLPSQIISQDESMLHAPIRLRTSIGGKEFVDTKKSLAWQENTSLKGRLKGKGRLGPLGISSNVTFEFDGFVWFVIRLNAEKPVEIEALSLEIPFRKGAATLINSGDWRVGRGTGSLPEKGISKNLKTELPILWVGNEKSGLQWFAEDLKNWTLNDPEKSAEIIPGKEDILVRLNIIDTPLIMEGETIISFGLMATPVKPLPADWRTLKPSGTGAPRNIFFWLMKPVENLITPLFNYPVPAPENIAKIRETVRDYREKGEKGLKYLALAVLTPYCPEFLWQGEVWKKIPGARAIQWDDNHAGREDSFAWICPNCSDYNDFYLYIAEKAFRELDLDGFYFDFGWAASCSNTLHGCGWKDSQGNINPTFNILGTRELAKRIYVMTKTLKPDSMLAYHMSGVVQMPIHSFADIIIDGETLSTSVAEDKSYYSILPLDKFRAEFMPHPWGVVTLILPQFVRSAELYSKDKQGMLRFWQSAEAAKPMNHLIGLTLVHDSLCFMGDTYKYLKPVREAQDAFGWDEKTGFLPYWSNSNYISVESPVSKDIIVSAFRRQGRIMLVPFNNTDNDVTATLKLDFAGFGTSPSSFTDALSKDNFPLKANRVSFPLAARSFRMLVAAPEKQ